jgi:glycosyltransferase involved in cell wall biosynthesis
MSGTNPYLSVIISCYNEGKVIEKNIVEIDKYLRGEKITYEILMIVDGSPDGTGDIVRSYQPEVKNLHIIENPENRGKGYAVRQGLLKATGELRLFLDADGSTSITHLETFLPEFAKGYDVVIGSRRLKGAHIQVHQPRFREIMGEMGNWLIRLVLGLWGYWDTQCGFKMLTAQAAEELASRMVVDRFGFDFELIALAQRAGFATKQMPVRWVNWAESSVTLTGPNGFIQVLLDLFKTKWRLMTGQYSPLK